MRKLDAFLLKGLHRVSNWTYTHLNIDNYTIATLILIVSVGVSIFAGIEAHRLALQDTNPEIARFRDSSAIMGVALTVMIAFFMITGRRYVGEIFTRGYDLGKRDRLLWAASAFLRWSVILLFFISLPIQSRWYGMLDMTLIGLAGWFLACGPPDMELRMKKAFRNFEIPQ